MENTEIKMDYYRLEKIAKIRGMDVEDLLDYADMGLLKIHILVYLQDNYSKIVPFPISSQQARIALVSPARYLAFNYHLSLPDGRVTLVITHKEKMLFDEKYPISESDAHEEQPEKQATADKKKPEELEIIAKKLKEVGEDPDVIAAILHDKHGAKDYQLVNILKIANHLAKATSKNRAANRAVHKGRKILKARDESKLK